MTDLCVAIFVRDIEQARRDMRAAAAAGADLVELRLDALTENDRRTRFWLKDPLNPGTDVGRDKPVPTIATCRPTWEGGHSQLTDVQRLDLLYTVSSHSRYVDVELQTLRNYPGTPCLPSMIVSSHDFNGRPPRLHNIVIEMNESPGTVNKIVWTARTIRDNLEAFEILRNRQKPTIALCMGEAGLISRILAKKFGAFLTFASLETGGGTAPGQISIADMKTLYRWDRLGASTRVYGVVGSPIMHSMSPAIHNAGFDAVDHDGVYLPLLVEPGYESFKAFMESFLHCEGLDLSGLSVTIPHKENCLRYLQEKGAETEPLARTIGTVNTVVIDPAGGALRGFNTDYAAILDAITAKLGTTREGLANRRVAVIGAGGTGRTAVAALAHYGADVTVYNRTAERAQALADEFNGRTGRVTAAPLDQLSASACEIYLNTTSVGMYPNVDASPVGDQPPRWSSGTLVFDTIYNPIRTRLLQQAEQAGAMTISGVEMFLRQAVGQFEAWTGKPAPIAVMRRVIESRLAGK